MAVDWHDRFPSSLSEIKQITPRNVKMLSNADLQIALSHMHLSVRYAAHLTASVMGLLTDPTSAVPSVWSRLTKTRPDRQRLCLLQHLTTRPSTIR